MFFKGMSLRKPEKQAVPPVPSGPKPYENALRASGSSTTMRDHRRLKMTYDGVDQLLCICPVRVGSLEQGVLRGKR